MLKPYTETQKARIAANILKAVRDPQKLTKQSYDFLNLCAGFIAHYNHAGFVDYYARGEGNLRQDLLENRLLN